MACGFKMQEQMMGREKRPAVFLDRDGVLTEERSYITSIDNLRIFPYAAECIKQIHQKGYLAVVITNQSGVARGLLTEDALQEMNVHLMEETGVDAVFYCPHHPEGRVSRYAKNCRCRKPETGLFEKACREYDIDMTNSYMVGDRASDILAGQKAGLKTVLLESGYGTKGLEREVKPNYVFGDLRDVVGIL